MKEVSLTQFIRNIEKLDRNSAKYLKKEIYNLFEPIVFQMVLTTRMDTGRARAELGMPFIKEIISSQRILDAIQHDVEVNAAAYNFWNTAERAQSYSSFIGKMISNNKISLNITSDEPALAAQEYGGKDKYANEVGLPSQEHPRPMPSRHIRYHLKRISDNITIAGDLEYFESGMFLNKIVKDIRNRAKNVVKKVRMVLFS